ncbi:MAG: hypothetical protein IJ642_12075 [Oscillospiraceae bacterium]|nr:hypothetical protein [Oscillospiraceae bacterium]
MQKRFIRVCHNTEYGSDGDFHTFGFSMTQEELIPVNNLLKVYKYCPADNGNYIIVYTWFDPVLNTVREFKENFGNEISLKNKFYELEELLNKA